MPASRRNKPVLPLDETAFAVKPRKAVPHQFVLDAIDALAPGTLSMFGCLAVYVEDKIVLILRDRRDGTADNGGVARHHRRAPRESAPRVPEYAIHSGIGKEGNGQVLPVDAPDFEEAALRACELIVARDPRIGKVPGARRASGSGARKAAKSAKRAKAPNPAKLQRD